MPRRPAACVVASTLFGGVKRLWVAKSIPELTE